MNSNNSSPRRWTGSSRPSEKCCSATGLASLAAVAAVGGGAAIPLLTARLSERLQVPAITTPQPLFAAAIGAATPVQCNLRQRRRRPAWPPPSTHRPASPEPSVPRPWQPHSRGAHRAVPRKCPAGHRSRAGLVRQRHRRGTGPLHRPGRLHRPGEPPPPAAAAPVAQQDPYRAEQDVPCGTGARRFC